MKKKSSFFYLISLKLGEKTNTYFMKAVKKTAKEKPMRKNEILTVDVSNYGQPNSAWRVSLERSRNVKYVASVKNGKINKVYTVENAKKREDGRVNFKLVTASDDVQKKYKNFDVSRGKGSQNPCRYYKAI